MFHAHLVPFQFFLQFQTPWETVLHLLYSLTCHLVTCLLFFLKKRSKGWSPRGRGGAGGWWVSGRRYPLDLKDLKLVK